MRFSYSSHMQNAFPERVTGVMAVDSISEFINAREASQPFLDRVRDRLSKASESTFPEIQAWRRTYTAMGLKPTQYRCAAEALLRRFRKEGALPEIHPLVDLCNAASMAFAIPVAVFDSDRLTGDMIVRQAMGNETYLSFSGESEAPEPDEVIFADAAGHAHARRWANKQSRLSAVSDQTRRALIVAEAHHTGASDDIERLMSELGAAISATFENAPQATLLLFPEAAYESQELSAEAGKLTS